MADTLDQRIQSLQEDFKALGSWSQRLQHLVDIAQELESAPEADRTPETLITGCLSPLWLTARGDRTGVIYQGFSPGVIPGALTALVVRIFTGLPAPDILAWNGDLAGVLGLKSELTPTRQQALVNLVQRAKDLAQKFL